MLVFFSVVLSPSSLNIPPPPPDTSVDVGKPENQGMQGKKGPVRQKQDERRMRKHFIFCKTHFERLARPKPLKGSIDPL